MFIVEGKMVDKQNVENDIVILYIDFGFGIQFFVDNFRGCVVGGVVIGFEEVFVCYDVVEIEIGDFDVQVFIQK